MEYQDQLEAEHDAKVAGWIEQIWEESLAPYGAEKWARDYEALINDGPALLEAAAHARQSGDYEYLGRMLMARLNAWVKRTAEFVSEEIGK